MGLYLKCPECQAKSPLYEKVCSQCGQSLENLPREQRVYVVEAGAAPTRARPAAPPAAPPAAVKAPSAGPAPAPKKPKGPKKKKA